MTIAQQLAFLDFESQKPVNDPYVIQVDSLLNRLSNKYHEPKDSIADYTQRVQSLLKEKNISITAVDLMQNVDTASVPMITKSSKYKEVAALIGLMMSNTYK